MKSKPTASDIVANFLGSHARDDYSHEVYIYGNGIRLYVEAPDGNQIVTVRLNWPSKGPQTALEACAFAASLTEATCTALQCERLLLARSWKLS